MTATGLAKWQMEKLKNLNFTKEKLRRMGDAIYPPLDEEPIEMNDMKWRIKRIVVKEKDPLEVQISAFRDGEDTRSLTTLVTLFEDTSWTEARP